MLLVPAKKQDFVFKILKLGYLSLLFHAGQAAIKLPSAEASKRAQCMSPGQYAPYIKGIMKTL